MAEQKFAQFIVLTEAETLDVDGLVGISVVLMQFLFQLSHVSCWAMLFSHAPPFVLHSHDNSSESLFSPLDS